MTGMPGRGARQYANSRSPSGVSNHILSTPWTGSSLATVAWCMKAMSSLDHQKSPTKTR